METKIAAKLLEFQTSIEAIKKDGKNSFFKKPDGKASTYATLPNILSEVKPILNALKIILLQPISNNEVKSVIIDSASGEQLESSIPLPSGLNAQQMGSAITYFRRYTLCSLLALEIDEDDDGNSASNPPKSTEGKVTEKPWLNKNSEQLEKAIEFVANGGTVSDIEKKYKLSKEVKELLTKCVTA